MARRSDHTKDELKELILAAAWKIVGKNGFENLTARRAAKDIGYAPGTIYTLFQSMDDLYLQINSKTLDMLYDVLNSPLCNDAKKTPLQNMKTMANLYMEFARTHRPYWLMLFNHKMPEERKSQDWYQKKIDRLFMPLEKLFQPLFSSTQAKQKKIAARVLWASVHSLCFLQETGKIPLVGGKAPAQEMSSYLIDTFVSGLKKS